MNLYLLRHGIAEDLGMPGILNDADRPLTAKGEQKLEEVARAMAALDLSFDLILSSPYLRARQTTAIIAKAFSARKRIEFTDALTPGASPRKLVELLNHRQPLPESVLLSSHEPFLSTLISLLVCGDTHASVVMKKGSLCKLTIESLKPARCASLDWLLTPKAMALMA